MSVASAGGGGEAPRVVDQHFVAVYDPADGRVLHVHTVRVLAGGRMVGKEEAEAEALEAARRHGHAVGQASTLHSKEVPRPGAYRVDPETMRLVALDVPRRR